MVMNQQVHETAKTVLRALNRGTQWQDDLRDIIKEHNCKPGYLPSAAKYLRNCGYKIATIRAGSLSRWYLAQTAAEQQAYIDDRMRDWFSEAISDARAFHGTAIEAETQRRAITLGGVLGMPPAKVLRMCRPIVNHELDTLQNMLDKAKI